MNTLRPFCARLAALVWLLFGSAVALLAQNDDLLSLLEEEAEVEYTTASFKTTRVVNGHSIENTGAGVLDFKISRKNLASLKDDRISIKSMNQVLENVH